MDRERKESKKEIINNLFKPGNLRWGATGIERDDFVNVITRGLLPAHTHTTRNPLDVFRGDAVCFSMIVNISPEDPLFNYKIQLFEGPRDDENIYEDSEVPKLSFTAILTPEDLLSTYGEKVE